MRPKPLFRRLGRLQGIHGSSSTQGEYRKLLPTNPAQLRQLPSAVGARISRDLSAGMSAKERLEPNALPHRVPTLLPTRNMLGQFL